MSPVHDTITEALRQHHDVRELHADGTKTYHCEKCCCDKRCGSHSLAEHLAHQAGCVLDALSAAGFVVRKQVEPPALRQEWTWSWPNGSARGVPGYGYPVDSAEEALAEAGVHDRRNANVVTRFVSEWQQVEP